MLRRIAESLRAIWARINKPPDLPKYRPIEFLSGHLRSRKQEAMLKFGNISPIGRSVFESLLRAIDTPCTLEVIVSPNGRDIEAIQQRVDSRGIGSVYWPIYRQRKADWTQDEFSVANGHEVLLTIHSAIAHAKAQHRAEWCGKEWSRHAGLAEASDNGLWYHMQMLIGQRNDLGATCLITFHFLISVDAT